MSEAKKPPSARTRVRRQSHRGQYDRQSLLDLWIPEPVAGTAATERVLRRMMAQFFPGRWDQLRPVSLKELKATRVLSVKLDEASVKIRTGPPVEVRKDRRWPVWAGVVPIQTVIGALVADVGADAGVGPVPSVDGIRRLASQD